MWFDLAHLAYMLPNLKLGITNQAQGKILRSATVRQEHQDRGRVLDPDGVGHS
jgi:hypothetical protein